MGRRHMVIDLEAVPQPPALDHLRHPERADAEALAELMLDAYAGTIDADGSETLEDARTEVAGWFDGASGEPMLEHSYVATDGDLLIGAVLAARFEGRPLIAYAFTRGSHKGRGVATTLTLRALRSLRDAGERQAHLWVTAGNDPAERIYEGIGFRDVEV